MIRSFLIGAAILSASPAQAATYDVVTDYDAPVFSYGSGTNGGAFASLPYTDTSNCFGVSGFSCHQTAANAHPVIGVNTTGADISTGTVLLAKDALYMHPANGTPNTDAILKFTAPVTSTYKVTGSFVRLDFFNGYGDGTIASIFKTVAGSPTSLYTQAISNGSFNSPYSFGTLTAQLAAGDTLTFGVNNGPNNEYTYDSTGLRASIAAVPEPAQWALMIGGFGMVGGALRSRRRSAAFA